MVGFLSASRPVYYINVHINKSTQAINGSGRLRTQQMWLLQRWVFGMGSTLNGSGEYHSLIFQMGLNFSRNSSRRTLMNLLANPHLYSSVLGLLE